MVALSDPMRPQGSNTKVLLGRDELFQEKHPKLRTLADVDAETAARFHELCVSCGITGELERAIIQLGLGSPRSMARLFGHYSVEFRSKLLGIQISGSRGGPRPVNHEEEQKLRQLYDLCRLEQGLPTRRNTRLSSPSPSPPGSRAASPEQARFQIASENAGEYAATKSGPCLSFTALLDRVGISRALEAALDQQGLGSIDAMIRLKGVAQLRALLRNLRFDSGSGEIRNLTPLEQEQVLELHKASLEEAGLPKTLGNSFILGDHVLQNLRLVEDNPPLSKVISFCGLDESLDSVLSALSLFDAASIAQLRAGGQFESVVLGGWHDFNDGMGLRRLHDGEKDQLKLLYESCRKIRGLPTGFYAHLPTLRSSMLEKSEKTSELLHDLSRDPAVLRRVREAQQQRERKEAGKGPFGVIFDSGLSVPQTSPRRRRASPQASPLRSPLQSEQRVDRPPSIFFWPNERDSKRGFVPLGPSAWSS